RRRVISRRSCRQAARSARPASARWSWLSVAVSWEEISWSACGGLEQRACRAKRPKKCEFGLAHWPRGRPAGQSGDDVYADRVGAAADADGGAEDDDHALAGRREAARHEVGGAPIDERVGLVHRRHLA